MMLHPLRPTSDLISGYPKTAVCADGSAVTVRPLRADDEPALAAFFGGIPAHDRWWLREDVSDPAVIHRWITDLDYDRVLPLIATVEGSIVADATLHRRGFGARQRLAEVRVVVAPAYRGRGLGYMLLLELAEIAAAAGLERLEAEIASRAQTGALEAIEQMGFQRVGSIDNHLIAQDGAYHDIIYLVYPLAET